MNQTSLHPNQSKVAPKTVDSEYSSDFYDSGTEGEDYEVGESYWAILIWNLPVDYTQWIVVFELIAHIRIMVEYPSNIYNYPVIVLLLVLLGLSITHKVKKVYKNGNRNMKIGVRREKIFRWCLIIIGAALTLLGMLYFTIAISVLNPLFYFTVVLDYSIYLNQDKIKDRLTAFLAQLWLFSHINFGGSFFILYSTQNLKLYPINPLMTYVILIPLAVYIIIIIVKIFLHKQFKKASLFIVSFGSKDVSTPKQSVKTGHNDAGSFKQGDHLHDIPSMSNGES